MLDRSVDGARGQGECHYRSDAEQRAARERLAVLRRDKARLECELGSGRVRARPASPWPDAQPRPLC